MYMVWETLDERFNAHQWGHIRQLPAHIFLSVQEAIVEQLLRNQKLYNKYFHNFYSNHAKLLSWLLLATEKKSEIQPYIFRVLVNNGLIFYNKKIKEVFEGRLPKAVAQLSPHSPRETQLMQEEVYRDFFNDLLSRIRAENSEKPLNLKLYGRRNPESREAEKMDGHDFYIETFNACNGWKYIFYNYEKHMQGLSEMGKYNQKIRQKESKGTFEHKEEPSPSLLDFQQEEPGREKCRVKKLSEVLGETGSARGLMRLASKNSLKKIVFVNHQGKPCTYLISRRMQKCL